MERLSWEDVGAIRSPYSWENVKPRLHRRGVEKVSVFPIDMKVRVGLHSVCGIHIVPLDAQTVEARMLLCERCFARGYAIVFLNYVDVYNPVQLEAEI